MQYSNLSNDPDDNTVLPAEISVIPNETLLGTGFYEYFPLTVEPEMDELCFSVSLDDTISLAISGGNAFCDGDISVSIQVGDDEVAECRLSKLFIAVQELCRLNLYYHDHPAPLNSTAKVQT